MFFRLVNPYFPIVGKTQFGLEDQRVLLAVEGWLELGDLWEANEELKNISLELRVHPDVLELRWQIYAKESNWEACRDIARVLTQTDPGRALGWLHFAEASRRAPYGSLHVAREILLLVMDKFQNLSLFPYRLACYECQLGNLNTAKLWLKKAFSMEEKRGLRLMALNELDLDPLRKNFPELGAQWLWG